MLRDIRRALAAILTVSYTLTNVVFVHAAEGRFWEERRRAVARVPSAGLMSQLPAAAPLRMDVPAPGAPSVDVLPPAVRGVSAPVRRALVASSPFAALRSFHASSRPGAPVVFLIQDLHGAEEAQKNVSALLERWSADGPVWVGLEGASGPFDLSDARELAGPVAAPWLAGYFLEKDVLGGAEAAAIAAANPPALWGLEEKALYGSHAEALREGLKARPAAQAALARAASTLAALKRSRYSDDLKAFDAASTAYHAGGSLGDFARFLTKEGRGGPNLRRFVSALEAETSMDFKTVEADRARLIERLTQRLAPADLQRLAADSVAVRSGALSASVFYEGLLARSRAQGVELSDLPAFRSYAAYVVQAEAIDRTALLTELSQAERAAADALARTPEEKILVALSRDAGALDKLVRHAMTPEDWAAYSLRRAETLDLEGRLARFPTSDFSDPKPLDPLLKPFEDFCRLALERDRALADDAWFHLPKEGVAAVVAGGFHSEGMTRRLLERGAGVAVLTPRISRLPDDHYADVFDRQPMPLEKLFAGHPVHLIRALASGNEPIDTASLSRQEDFWRATVLLGLILRGTLERFKKPPESMRAAAARRGISLEGEVLETGGGARVDLSLAEGAGKPVHFTGYALPGDAVSPEPGPAESLKLGGYTLHLYRRDTTGVRALWGWVEGIRSRWRAGTPSEAMRKHLRGIVHRERFDVFNPFFAFTHRNRSWTELLQRLVAHGAIAAAAGLTVWLGVSLLSPKHWFFVVAVYAAAGKTLWEMFQKGHYGYDLLAERFGWAKLAKEEEKSAEAFETAWGKPLAAAAAAVRYLQSAPLRSLGEGKVAEARKALEAVELLGIATPRAMVWLEILRDESPGRTSTLPPIGREALADLQKLLTGDIPLSLDGYPALLEVLRRQQGRVQTAFAENFAVDRGNILGMGILYKVFGTVDGASTSPAAVKELTEKSGAAMALWDLVVSSEIQEVVPGALRTLMKVDLPDGTYLVMERADGRDLQHFLEKNGPLDAAQAALLARTLLPQIAAAHAAGWLINDIKPQNIFLKRPGDLSSAVLGDFNLFFRKVRRNREESSYDLHWGTPEYMAPEITADESGDLHQFGVTLYEVLTGRLPWDFNRLNSKISRTPYDISKFRPDLPAPLAEFVMGLIQEFPGDRPWRTSADALAYLRYITDPRARDVGAPLEALWGNAMRKAEQADRVLRSTDFKSVETRARARQALEEVHRLGVATPRQLIHLAILRGDGQGQAAWEELERVLSSKPPAALRSGGPLERILNDYEPVARAAFEERFHVGEKLAEGTLTVVKEVLDSEGMAVPYLAVRTPEPKSGQSGVDYLRWDAMARTELQSVVPGLRRAFMRFGSGPDAVVVVERAEGEDMHRVLLRRGRRLPIESLAPLIDNVLTDLGAYHQAGWVHNDGKSGNVILAKADDLSSAGMDDVNFSFRQGAKWPAGSISGTPQYAAPEKLIGKGEMSPQTDLYEFGTTLYELLAGYRPYSDPDEKIAGRPPWPIKNYLEDLHPAVAQFVMNLIAWNPRDRPWETVAEVQAAWEKVKIEVGISPPRPAGPMIRLADIGKIGGTLTVLLLGVTGAGALLPYWKASIVPHGPGGLSWLPVLFMATVYLATVIFKGSRGDPQLLKRNREFYEGIKNELPKPVKMTPDGRLYKVGDARPSRGTTDIGNWARELGRDLESPDLDVTVSRVRDVVRLHYRTKGEKKASDFQVAQLNDLEGFLNAAAFLVAVEKTPGSEEMSGLPTPPVQVPVIVRKKSDAEGVPTVRTPVPVKVHPIIDLDRPEQIPPPPGTREAAGLKRWGDRLRSTTLPGLGVPSADPVHEEDEEGVAPTLKPLAPIAREKSDEEIEGVETDRTPVPAKLLQETAEEDIHGAPTKKTPLPPEPVAVAEAARKALPAPARGRQFSMLDMEFENLPGSPGPAKVEKEEELDWSTMLDSSPSNPKGGNATFGDLTNAQVNEVLRFHKDGIIEDPRREASIRKTLLSFPWEAWLKEAAALHPDLRPGEAAQRVRALIADFSLRLVRTPSGLLIHKNGVAAAHYGTGGPETGHRGRFIYLAARPNGLPLASPAEAKVLAAHELVHLLLRESGLPHNTDAAHVFATEIHRKASQALLGNENAADARFAQRRAEALSQELNRISKEAERVEKDPDAVLSWWPSAGRAESRAALEAAEAMKVASPRTILLLRVIGGEAKKKDLRALEVDGESLDESRLEKYFEDISDNYRLNVMLEKTAFSQIWEATDKATGQEVIVKLSWTFPLFREYWTHRRWQDGNDGVVRAKEAGFWRAKDKNDEVDGKKVRLRAKAIVMEYARGGSLWKSIGKLTPEQMLRVAKGLFRTLLISGERGQWHRDIKPSNILFMSDGDWDHPKLADFGNATSPHASGVRIISKNTPEFASPETLEDPSHPDDLYPSGATLYTAVTGKFTHADPSDKHSSPARPLEGFRPDFPADQREFVMGFIAKNPEDRWKSPAEVLEALHKIERGATEPVPPPSSSSFRSAMTLRLTYVIGKALLRVLGNPAPSDRDVELKVSWWLEVVPSLVPVAFVLFHHNRTWGQLLKRLGGQAFILAASALPFVVFHLVPGASTAVPAALSSLRDLVGYAPSLLALGLVLGAAGNMGAHYLYNLYVPSAPLTMGAGGWPLAPLWEKRAHVPDGTLANFDFYISMTTSLPARQKDDLLGVLLPLYIRWLSVRKDGMTRIGKTLGRWRLSVGNSFMGGPLVTAESALLREIADMGTRDIAPGDREALLLIRDRWKALGISSNKTRDFLPYFELLDGPPWLFEEALAAGRSFLSAADFVRRFAIPLARTAGTAERFRERLTVMGAALKAAKTPARRSAFLDSLRDAADDPAKIQAAMDEFRAGPAADGLLGALKASGGRWPFMQAYYDWVETRAAGRWGPFAGTFLGQAAAPTAVESGLFVGGGSFLLSWATGLPMEVSAAFMQSLWHLLHKRGERFGREKVSITLASALLLAAGRLLLPGVSPQAIVMGGVLLPHVAVNAVLSIWATRRRAALPAQVEKIGLLDVGVESLSKKDTALKLSGVVPPAWLLAAWGDAPFLLNGRFLVERMRDFAAMGRGGITFDAVDLAGRPLIIKTAPAASREGLVLLREIGFYGTPLAGSDAKPDMLEGGFARDSSGSTIVYLVLERLEGETLRGEGPLDAERGRLRALSAFKGLKDIHDRGIVHGDVKSENIIRTGERSRFIDFGFARRLPAGKREVVIPGDMISGTRETMAPEKILKHIEGFGTDIYALAADLYAEEAGMNRYLIVPGPDQTDDEIADEWEALTVEADPVPLDIHRPDLKGTILESVIMDLLHRDPAVRRLRTDEDILRALETGRMPGDSSRALEEKIKRSTPTDPVIDIPGGPFLDVGLRQKSKGEPPLPLLRLDNRPPRVLVVESDRYHRYRYGVLTGLKGNVISVIEEAEDGEQGLKKALDALDQGKPYDLIITNLRMPQMDGAEMIRSVRERHPEQAILLISDDPALDASAKELNVFAYRKPQSEAEFEPLADGIELMLFPPISPPGSYMSFAAPISLMMGGGAKDIVASLLSLLVLLGISHHVKKKGAPVPVNEDAYRSAYGKFKEAVLAEMKKGGKAEAWKGLLKAFIDDYLAVHRNHSSLLSAVKKMSGEDNEDELGEDYAEALQAYLRAEGLPAVQRAVFAKPQAPVVHVDEEIVRRNLKYLAPLLTAERDPSSAYYLGFVEGNAWKTMLKVDANGEIRLRGAPGALTTVMLPDWTEHALHVRVLHHMRDTPAFQLEPSEAGVHPALARSIFLANEAMERALSSDEKVFLEPEDLRLSWEWLDRFADAKDGELGPSDPPLRPTVDGMLEDLSRGVIRSVPAQVLLEETLARLHPPSPGALDDGRDAGPDPFSLLKEQEAHIAETNELMFLRWSQMNDGAAFEVIVDGVGRIRSIGARRGELEAMSLLSRSIRVRKIRFYMQDGVWRLADGIRLNRFQVRQMRRLLDLMNDLGVNTPRTQEKVVDRNLTAMAPYLELYRDKAPFHDGRLRGTRWETLVLSDASGRFLGFRDPRSLLLDGPDVRTDLLSIRVLHHLTTRLPFQLVEPDKASPALRATIDQANLTFLSSIGADRSDPSPEEIWLAREWLDAQTNPPDAILEGEWADALAGAVVGSGREALSLARTLALLSPPAPPSREEDSEDDFFSFSMTIERETAVQKGTEQKVLEWTARHPNARSMALRLDPVGRAVDVAEDASAFPPDLEDPAERWRTVILNKSEDGTWAASVDSLQPVNRFQFRVVKRLLEKLNGPPRSTGGWGDKVLLTTAFALFLGGMWRAGFWGGGSPLVAVAGVLAPPVSLHLAWPFWAAAAAVLGVFALRRRVLVVDGRKGTADRVRSYLRILSLPSWMAEVHQAKDGQEAFDRVSKITRARPGEPPYDLVIVGEGAPSAEYAAEQLRAGLPSVPVLAVPDEKMFSAASRISAKVEQVLARWRPLQVPFQAGYGSYRAGFWSDGRFVVSDGRGDPLASWWPREYENGLSLRVDGRGVRLADDSPIGEGEAALRVWLPNLGPKVPNVPMLFLRVGGQRSTHRLHRMTGLDELKHLWLIAPADLAPAARAMADLRDYGRVLYDLSVALDTSEERRRFIVLARERFAREGGLAEAVLSALWRMGREDMVKRLLDRSLQSVPLWDAAEEMAADKLLKAPAFAEVRRRKLSGILKLDLSGLRAKKVGEADGDGFPTLRPGAEPGDDAEAEVRVPLLGRLPSLSFLAHVGKSPLEWAIIVFGLSPYWEEVFFREFALGKNPTTLDLWRVGFGSVLAHWVVNHHEASRLGLSGRLLWVNMAARFLIQASGTWYLTDLYLKHHDLGTNVIAHAALNLFLFLVGALFFPLERVALSVVPRPSRRAPDVGQAFQVWTERHDRVLKNVFRNPEELESLRRDLMEPGRPVSHATVNQVLNAFNTLSQEYPGVPVEERRALRAAVDGLERIINQALDGEVLWRENLVGRRSTRWYRTSFDDYSEAREWPAAPGQVVVDVLWPGFRFRSGVRLPPTVQTGEPALGDLRVARLRYHTALERGLGKDTLDALREEIDRARAALFSLWRDRFWTRVLERQRTFGKVDRRYMIRFLHRLSDPAFDLDKALSAVDDLTEWATEESGAEGLIEEESPGRHFMFSFMSMVDEMYDGRVRGPSFLLGSLFDPATSKPIEGVKPPFMVWDVRSAGFQPNRPEPENPVRLALVAPYPDATHADLFKFIHGKPFVPAEDGSGFSRRVRLVHDRTTKELVAIDDRVLPGHGTIEDVREELRDEEGQYKAVTFEVNVPDVLDARDIEVKIRPGSMRWLWRLLFSGHMEWEEYVRRRAWLVENLLALTLGQFAGLLWQGLTDAGMTETLAVSHGASWVWFALGHVPDLFLGSSRDRADARARLRASMEFSFVFGALPLLFLLFLSQWMPLQPIMVGGGLWLSNLISFPAHWEHNNEETTAFVMAWRRLRWSADGLRSRLSLGVPAGDVLRAAQTFRDRRDVAIDAWVRLHGKLLARAWLEAELSGRRNATALLDAGDKAVEAWARQLKSGDGDMTVFEMTDVPHRLAQEDTIERFYDAVADLKVLLMNDDLIHLLQRSRPTRDLFPPAGRSPEGASGSPKASASFPIVPRSIPLLPEAAPLRLKSLFPKPGSGERLRVSLGHETERALPVLEEVLQKLGYGAQMLIDEGPHPHISIWETREYIHVKLDGLPDQPHMMVGVNDWQAVRHVRDFLFAFTSDHGHQLVSAYGDDVLSEWVGELVLIASRRPYQRPLLALSELLSGLRLVWINDLFLALAGATASPIVKDPRFLTAQGLKIILQAAGIRVSKENQILGTPEAREVLDECRNRGLDVEFHFMAPAPLAPRLMKPMVTAFSGRPEAKGREKLIVFADARLFEGMSGRPFQDLFTLLIGHEYGRKFMGLSHDDLEKARVSISEGIGLRRPESADVSDFMDILLDVMKSSRSVRFPAAGTVPADIQALPIAPPLRVSLFFLSPQEFRGHGSSRGSEFVISSDVFAMSVVEHAALADRALSSLDGVDASDSGYWKAGDAMGENEELAQLYLPLLLEDEERVAEARRVFWEAWRRLDEEPKLYVDVLLPLAAMLHHADKTFGAGDLSSDMRSLVLAAPGLPSDPHAAAGFLDPLLDRNYDQMRRHLSELDSLARISRTQGMGAVRIYDVSDVLEKPNAPAKTNGTRRIGLIQAMLREEAIARPLAAADDESGLKDDGVLDALKNTMRNTLRWAPEEEEVKLKALDRFMQASSDVSDAGKLSASKVDGFLKKRGKKSYYYDFITTAGGNIDVAGLKDVFIRVLELQDYDLLQDVSKGLREALQGVRFTRVSA